MYYPLNSPLWLLVKFKDKKAVWLYSKTGKNPNSLMNYWRLKNGFMWCKVHHAKNRTQIFWFNQNDEGVNDRTTSKKNY